MKKTSKSSFSQTKQDRSQKTLDDLMESANQIVNEADPEKFTSRWLAEKSGYALGTLVKRLGSVENIFLWVIKRGQQKNFESFANIIEEFNDDLPLSNLLEEITTVTFSAMKGVNPRVIRYFENRSAKNHNYSELLFDYADVLVKPFIKAAKKNKTNTFREISECEGRLIFRSILIFAERPFVENNPIAGTKEHRRIVIENLSRLLGK